MKNEEEVPMKNLCKFRLAAIMAFMILSLGATGAFAENRAGALEITPYVGGFNVDGDLNYDNGLAYGIGLGYNFTDKIGTEFTFHYLDTPYNGPISLARGGAWDFGSDDGYALLYKLDLVYNLTGLLPGDFIVPYLAAGPGAVTWYSDAKGVNSNTDFVLNYGGGVKVYLTRNIALKGDVRNVWNWNCGYDDDYSNLLYTAGLTFALGGKEEVKEEAPAPEPEPAPAPAPVVTPPPPPPAPAVKEQGSIIFRNIQFDLNKADIKPESYPILDEVVDYMKANPNVKMEVQGHTCNLGKAEYNMKLSDKRAGAVKTYLVGKGVAADRLEAKGYGLTKPVAPNDKEENRARNRRVEFKPIQ